MVDEVERELNKATAGLVCLTREALQSGWIHFEAGALARAVRKNETHSEASGAALYTYLLGVQPDELKGPLAEFQSTRFEREDTKKFCAAIVSSMRDNAPPRESWTRRSTRTGKLFCELGEVDWPAVGARAHSRPRRDIPSQNVRRAPGRVHAAELD